MVNTSFSRQLKRLGAPGIGIIVLGIVLFVLIFFLEYTYTYSDKHGNLVWSIIYAIPFPDFLTFGFLVFVTRSAERRQTPIPWHQQKSILEGLIFVSLSLIFLVELLNSLMHNGLPDAVGVPLIGVSLLLVLFFSVRFVIIRSSE